MNETNRLMTLIARKASVEAMLAVAEKGTSKHQRLIQMRSKLIAMIGAIRSAK